MDKHDLSESQVLDVKTRLPKYMKLKPKPKISKTGKKAKGKSKPQTPKNQRKPVQGKKSRSIFLISFTIIMFILREKFNFQKTSETSILILLIAKTLSLSSV